MIKGFFWNSTEHRLRALWRQLIQLVLFTVLLNIVFVIVNTLISVFHVHRGSGGGQVGTSVSNLAFDFPLSIALNAIVVLLSVWLMARFINREPFALFGFRFNRDWWLDCGFGLLLGLTLTAIVFLIELASGWITITDTFYSGLPGIPFGLAILSPFILFVGTAFYEETYFRGYPIRNLSQGIKYRSIGPTIAVVLIWFATSIVFGWFHHNNAHAVLLGLINIGLAGILFGLSYVLTGSLGLSIGIHIGWDFCQGCVFGTPVAGVTPWSVASFIKIVPHGPELFTGGGFGTDGGLLVTLAFLLGLLPVYFYVRWRYGKTGLHRLTEYTPRPGVIATNNKNTAEGSEAQTAL